MTNDPEMQDSNFEKYIHRTQREWSFIKHNVPFSGAVSSKPHNGPMRYI